MLERRDELTRDHSYLAAMNRDFSDIARYFLNADERNLTIIVRLMTENELDELRRRWNDLYEDLGEHTADVLKAAEAFIFGDRIPYDLPHREYTPEQFERRMHNLYDMNMDSSGREERAERPNGDSEAAQPPSPRRGVTNGQPGRSGRRPD